MIGKSLVNFFKNTRKRKCGDVAECKAAKQKAALIKKCKERNGAASTSLMTNMWDVKNFNPGLPVGEDDRTVDIHKDRLKKQFQLLPYSRRQTVINTSMSKTFPVRRKDILELQKTVVEILDEYPILADPLQVSCS